MLRKTRRWIGKLKLFLPGWLFVLSLILISVPILQRIKPNGLHLEPVPRIQNWKEQETTNKVALSLLAGKIDAGKNWARLSSDRYVQAEDFVKTAKQTSFETNPARTHLTKTGSMGMTSNHLWNSAQNKGVNVYIWRGLCCAKVNSLRQYPLFPTLPKQRLLRHTISSGPLGTWYAQRVMGYVHPPRTGYYIFHLDAHVFAEFWLGVKQSAQDVELIAKVAKESGKNSLFKPIGQTSRELYLEEGRKYFFDVLHVMNGGMMRRDHVNVTWKVPRSEKLTDVSEMFLSPLLNDQPSHLIYPVSTAKQNNLLQKPRSVTDTEINDADAGEDDEDYEGIEIPKRKTKLPDEFSILFGKDFDMENEYDRSNFEQILDMSNELLSILPSCSYEPTYAMKQTLKRFEGVWKTHFSSVFPDDGTKEFICIGNKQKKDCAGNGFLSEHEVFALVQMFVKKINQGYPG